MSKIDSYYEIYKKNCTQKASYSELNTNKVCSLDIVKKYY